MNTIEQMTYIKKADSQSSELHDLIKMRYSPRAFRETPLTVRDIELMLEAARWAPSSMNAQPWRYMYAFHGDKDYDKMVEALMPGNQPWASKAPALVLSFIKTKLPPSITKLKSKPPN